MRGYAIERLTSLLGNKWVAGVITLVFFTVAHFPFWGIANSIPIFLGALLLTLLHLLWRNLTVNIIAHITTDAIGFVLVPLFLSR
jgi:membrane protease YdiL (CAAX protease family)